MRANLKQLCFEFITDIQFVDKLLDTFFGDFAIGVPFSHMLIALASLHKGLGKLEVNETAIDEDLNKNWAVVAEAIQTILRREGFPKPYEALKGLTRTNSEEQSCLSGLVGVGKWVALKIEMKRQHWQSPSFLLHFQNQ